MVILFSADVVKRVAERKEQKVKKEQEGLDKLIEEVNYHFVFIFTSYYVIPYFKH